MKATNAEENLKLAISKAKELKLTVKLKVSDVVEAKELEIITFLAECYEILKKKKNKRDSVFGEVIDMKKQLNLIKADIKDPLKKITRQVDPNKNKRLNDVRVI